MQRPSRPSWGCVSFPGRAMEAMPRAHGWSCTTPRPAPAPNRQRSEAAGGERGGRAKPSVALSPHPQGSFYTLEKLGSSLSSSPTDCSCCCRCSDLADHVARGDLGAAWGGWELLVPARAGDTGDTGDRGGSTAMDFCLLTLSSPSVHPFRELAHALTS